MLTDPAARSLYGVTWADEARRMVALFRPSHDLWRGDAAFAGLVDRLRLNCPEFEGWWAAHGIGAPVSGTKLLQHPILGTLSYDYASFQANDDPALKLTLYTRLQNGPSRSRTVRFAEGQRGKRTLAGGVVRCEA